LRGQRGSGAVTPAGDVVDFHALFESAPGLYAVLGPDLRILAATDAFLAATLTRREDIVGRRVFDVFAGSPGDGGAGVATLRASLDRVRRHRVPDTMAVQRHDLRLPDERGGGLEERWWSIRHTPVLMSGNRLEYVVQQVEDVTELVRRRGEGAPAPVALSREPAELEAEVLRRSVELHQANTLLRAASEAKNEFLSRMSHELRTPLAAIVGFGELLSLSDLDADRQNWVRMIRKAGESLVALVDEVVDLSRIESGHLELSPEVVALGPMLAHAVELMRPLAAASETTILPPVVSTGRASVHADSQRLEQVVINLLSNAIKYNRPGGEVRVTVSPGRAGCVRIGVEDTGPGIDPESVEKLFTPFERLGAASGGIQGTGLGLVLSRNLVEAMGGTMGVESDPSGSTFWVELEAAAPAAAADEDDALLEVRDYGAARTLLYVEDVVAHVHLIEELLRRRPSVRLVPAMLGQMGLDLAREHRPDLILLDVDLPDLGGGDVLLRLRDDEATRDIPVVVLTDGSDDPLAGASACLSKPIGVRRVLEVLDEFLA